MDRKTLALVAAIVALMIGSQYVARRIWPDVPVPLSAKTPLSQAIGSTNTTDSAAVGGAAPALPTYEGPEKLVALENNLLQLVFTTHGGGLKQVGLLAYPAHIPRRDQVASALKDKKEFASLNLNAPIPALAIGPGTLIGDGQFNVVKQGDSVVSEKLTQDGLVIRYEYRLSTNSYEVEAVMRLENRSTATVPVPGYDWVVGTASPLDPHDAMDKQGLYWYDGSSAEHITSSWFGSETSSGCTLYKKTPRPVYSSDATNIVWAAVYNQFFALLAEPSTPGVGLRSVDVPLAKPSASAISHDGSLNSNPRGYQTALLYPAQSLPAGQAIERHFRIYAGPKMYRILKNSEHHWDKLMDFTGIGGPCAKGLLLILNGIHSFIPSYGWTIVVTTILIKLIFWPLTLASTRSMKRMQALQPQMNALREKYKDDPQKQQEKLLLFMRENRINPASGCLPMLVQFPVFIGFFYMLRTAIELRGESFLWCTDLSQPDTLFVIPQLDFIPILGVPGLGLAFNLMPLFYIGSALWLSHSQPISPQMDASQQKMMRYMPLAFCTIFYNYSAGLTLYWTVQNLMNILQNKLTRSQAKPAGKAVVIAKSAKS